MSSPALRTRLKRGAVGALALTLGVVTAGMAAEALTATDGLPLGRSSLRETRTTRDLAPGVKLTRIKRGVRTRNGTWAEASDGTPWANGPWRIRELEIDPKVATGHLRSTFGADLARVQTTSSMVAAAGGIAGTNGGYFDITSDPASRGNPVGLAIAGGVIESEPTSYPPEAHFLLDAATTSARVTKLRWRGSLTNVATGTSVFVDHINEPPEVPLGCGGDPTQCPQQGEVSIFTRDWGARTPAGAGVEAVLNAAGCLVTTAKTRGVTLTRGQFSVQATGLDVPSLLSLLALGCVQRVDTLTDPGGRKVALTPSTFAVNGRYQLLKAGKVVAPTGDDPFLARSPRTVAGTTADGRIILLTIDGRALGSVGATLTEAAQVARYLGMVEALNLDGGGSTTLAVDGEPANVPSDGQERPVGEALVYVPLPWRPRS